MIKQFYCIVDAGGNIYEYTFSKTKDGSKWNYLSKDFGQNLSIPLTYFDEKWNLKEENGDRIVLCDIDTKENVEIKINNG